MHLLVNPHEMPELWFYRRVNGSEILRTSYIQDRFEHFLYKFWGYIGPIYVYIARQEN